MKAVQPGAAAIGQVVTILLPRCYPKHGDLMVAHSSDRSVPPVASAGRARTRRSTGTTNVTGSRCACRPAEQDLVRRVSSQRTAAPLHARRVSGAGSRRRATEGDGSTARGCGTAPIRRPERSRHGAPRRSRNCAKEYIERHAKSRSGGDEDMRLLNGSPHKKKTGKTAARAARQAVGRDEGAATSRGATSASCSTKSPSARPIMANRTLALVRKMFNFAIEHDWLDVESLPDGQAGRAASGRATAC